MSSLKNKKPFKFKQFEIYQDQTAMKIGTDGVLLGAWANVSSAQNILDIGTGTGVIAIMAAQRNSTSKIHAIEIDESAFLQANKNIRNCKWFERISIQHISLQAFTKNTSEKYDAILSNPPFFNNGTLPKGESRENARHTSTLTQDEMLYSIAILLNPSGIFSTIQPRNEGRKLIEKANKIGLFCTKKIHVKSKKGKPIERLLLQFEKTKKECLESELIIQFDKRNDYTQDYMDLTKDFYLKM